ncbi:MAG: tol-pal system protein YbgF [Desulfobacterales bacterium]
MKNSMLTLIICLFFLGGCATVQDKIALENRIFDLEQHRIKSNQDLKKIRENVEKFGKNWESKDQNFTGQYASMRAEIKKLEDEIRTFDGKLEELEFAIGRIKASKGEIQEPLNRLKEEDQKIADRLSAVEQYLGLSSVPKKVETPVRDSIPTNEGRIESEKALYDQAKRDFDKGDFESARKGFQNFIKLYSKSENADNAQFWIGETYYREAWFEKAILEYEEVKKRYPKGNKIPSALLKQGMSFQQLKEKANARLILEELVKKFPGSSEADIAEKILKTL